MQLCIASDFPFLHASSLIVLRQVKDGNLVMTFSESLTTSRSTLLPEIFLALHEQDDHGFAFFVSR
jgi:membrane-bound lytic murein transglycosylase MltF